MRTPACNAYSLSSTVLEASGRRSSTTNNRNPFHSITPLIDPFLLFLNSLVLSQRTRPVENVCQICRGSKVIEARGKSSALSAANAIASHLRDWLGPRPETPSEAIESRWQNGDSSETEVADSADRNTHMAAGGVSMGVFSDGNPYGVPEGLICSFPVLCGAGLSRLSA